MIENTSLGAATDSDGDFFIINIPPGNYSVLARMMGYVPQRIQNIRVIVDLTTKANFSLTPTILEVDEAIVVIAQREMIQRDLTSSEVSISAKTIENLPVRSISEIM